VVKPDSYQLILADESSGPEAKPDSYQLILADETIEVAGKSGNTSSPAVSSIAETTEPIVPDIKGAEKQILSSTILFGFDSYRLSESAIATLEQLRALMLKNPDLSVEVTGFTDSMGSFKYNLYLSQKRADQVISYLVAKGIPRDNFISKAAGMSGYIAKNTKEDGSDNPEGRKFNRRAELYLLNSDHLGIVMEGLFIPEHLRFAARESEISAAQLAGGSFLMANSPAIPDGKMVYTVQLLAMRKTVRKGFFNPSDSIISIKGEDGFTRYITGFFESREEAEKHLEVYVKRGYNDAFISHTSRYTGQRTPFLIKSEEVISYTVQFIALKNPSTPDKFGSIENLAVHLGQDGLYRYSSGTFQKRHEAEEYLLKIKERGFRDAFIYKIVNGI
jgi:outer membrane protein OmpA-like peptidoglycan-associated protein